MSTPQVESPSDTAARLLRVARRTHDEHGHAKSYGVQDVGSCPDFLCSLAWRLWEEAQESDPSTCDHGCPIEPPPGSRS